MSEKWLGAGRMIVVSLVVIALLTAGLWLWAPYRSELRWIEPEYHGLAVSDFRYGIVLPAAIAYGVCMAVYWLFAALLGKGDIRSGRLANGLLAVTWISILILYMDRAFGVLGPLGYFCPEGSPGDHEQPPCMRVAEAEATFFWITQLWCFLLSAIARIVHSRRQAPAIPAERAAL